eukprot:SM000003S11042  [mRNA]  locus=s3:505191:506230:- [translate_table: standard]
MAQARAGRHSVGGGSDDDEGVATGAYGADLLADTSAPSRDEVRARLGADADVADADEAPPAYGRQNVSFDDVGEYRDGGGDGGGGGVTDYAGAMYTGGDGAAQAAAGGGEDHYVGSLSAPSDPNADLYVATSSAVGQDDAAAAAAAGTTEASSDEQPHAMGPSAASIGGGVGTTAAFEDADLEPGTGSYIADPVGLHAPKAQE